MVWLSQELYFLCVLNVLHPTIFLNGETGECVAMCDANSDRPHACFDANGQSLTDCFDANHNPQLCDAYFIEVTDEDYEVTK